MDFALLVFICIPSFRPFLPLDHGAAGQNPKTTGTSYALMWSLDARLRREPVLGTFFRWRFLEDEFEDIVMDLQAGIPEGSAVKCVRRMSSYLYQYSIEGVYMQI